MSLFHTNDIDLQLFSYMEIMNLRQLRQVNKYYSETIYKYIEDFYIFFQNAETINFPFKDYSKKYTIFYKSIQNGKIDICKYLHNKYKYNLNKDCEFPFRLSIHYNHINIAKWLLPYVKNILDSFRNESAISYALKYGNINTIKWLFDQIKSDLQIPEWDCKYFIPFRSFDIIKTIFEMIKIEPTSDVFVVACANNDINVPKYILQKNIANNITDIYRRGFQVACRYDRLDTMIWLHSLDKSLDSFIESHLISLLSDAIKNHAINAFTYLLQNYNLIDIDHINVCEDSIIYYQFFDGLLLVA